MPLPDPQPKALFFDVFGTCVDWRKTVTNALWNAAKEALDSPSASLSSQVRSKASNMTYEDWGEVAQDWRNTYLVFTRSIAADPTIPYKTVDQHHLHALREILTTRELILPGPQNNSSTPAEGSLLTDHQIVKLSLIWHYLEPWPDTVQGIRELNKNFTTCTLSNGNVSLLTDMTTHGHMPFTHIFSSEMFKSYKPSPKVYLGAVEKLGLKPEECMMVAAHLDDLKHAREYGLRTCYVARPREERYPELLGQGIEEVFVGEGEVGFVTAAERLGVEVGS
ncbi:hypothetical protein M409DRAFT_62170 [Zasmidium cellare ATCC 36951]|uniref:Haloacid dehalogenase n=1 Tax=Zasmidium cellare ATCC 36951 TaxID=1080233 RepID=A0A6A6D4I6_ZASCE|nr:uncharacterized protein M409DRAFT_62170 [Zasmidium cellare ATCC 36951]KAF2173975.1 hypothetical protein M409DRAFT_62170 [Zasmidium cellare ATCC 36951]